MRIFGALKAILVGAALLVEAAPANAATFLITFTGTISEGHDTTGVFGAAGGDLAGKSYTSVYSVSEWALGSFYRYGSTSIDAYGVFSEAASGFPSSFTMTVDGHGVSLESFTSTQKFIKTVLYNEDTVGGKIPAYDNVFAMALGHVETFDNVNGVYGVATNLFLQDDNHLYGYGSTMLNADFQTGATAYHALPSDGSEGSFQIGLYDYRTQQLAWSVRALLHPETVSVAMFGTIIGVTPSAAPEPAVWEMMILGFAVVGGAMRRRAKVSRQTVCYSFD
jgi:hypothetical protein